VAEADRGQQRPPVNGSYRARPFRFEEHVALASPSSGESRASDALAAFKFVVAEATNDYCLACGRNTPPDRGFIWD